MAAQQQLLLLLLRVGYHSLLLLQLLQEVLLETGKSQPEVALLLIGCGR
jgi:hypothetical protein